MKNKRIPLIIAIILISAIAGSPASATDFEKVAKLIVAPGPGPNNDAQASDRLGHSVAIFGNMAVVGAELHDHNGDMNSGGAYIFNRDASGTWSGPIEITDVDQDAGDRFGFAVAVSNDNIIVSAPDEDHRYTLDSGVVYVFERDALGDWTRQAQLEPNSSDPEERFGGSVAISGKTVVVGNAKDRILPDIGGFAEAGSVYVFTEDAAANWPAQRLFPKRFDTTVVNDPTTFGHFGDSVSIDNDTLVVGAKDVADNGFQAGAAYVYVRDSGGTWVFQDKLLPNPELPAIIREREQFGDDVDLSGDTIVVGVPLHDGNGTGSDTGTAYVFERNASGVWHQTAKLEAFDNMLATAPQNLAEFGESVAIAGNRIVVGANGIEAAYLFDRDSNSNWVPHQPPLTVTDPIAVPSFGFSAAMDGSRVVIGAHLDSRDFLTHTGSAYVFESTSLEELIERLIVRVVSLNLQRGIENALDAKLDAAVQALDDAHEGNDGSAINMLVALQQLIAAQSGNMISTSDAEDLISAAQEVIDLLISQ